MKQNSNTIVALSTPMGRGAIAVVRMSGDNAIEIAKQIFTPFPKQANYLRVGSLQTGDFADQAMCVFFLSPHSYTGEDMVEFHCHGGNAVSSTVIQRCISLGARMAYNGEFTQRAFVNGKQNLTNAEGVIQLIDAENKYALKAGENLLNNVLGKATVSMQQVLLDLTAQTEVALDYPEEDLDLPTVTQISRSLEEVKAQLTQLLSTAKEGRIITEGIDVAIVGKTNVGKSSLFNALIGQDRAIVTDIEGTTRDVITSSVLYKDIRLNFTDTAGLRDTQDVIENLGIERAKQALEQADVILHVIDNDYEPFIDTLTPVITVYNKCDKLAVVPADTPNLVYVSAKYATNVNAVKQSIYDLFDLGKIEQNGMILTNSRHIECLSNALRHVEDAIESCNQTTLDCVAVNIRSAWEELGKITGENASQDVIDRIFGKFCLGK